MSASDRPPVDLPAAPPEAWERVIRVARLASRPLEKFLAVEASSGIVLLLAAAFALAWANSPWRESYVTLWSAPIGIRLGGFVFERSLEWVVNDGLMVVFFFVVGLEIRREIHHGELSEWRRAALPFAAALGGMLVPALLFFTLTHRGEARPGWGIPMATDIAFALGILSLLGSRVPPALRVLLLALAVIDDLGAILVIALFYSTGVSFTWLALAALALLSIVGLQRLGVRAKLAYVPSALVAWGCTYAAGIHPTIAGVAVGLLTPVRAWLGPDGFLVGVRREIEELDGWLERGAAGGDDPHGLVDRLRAVDRARREAISPAEGLIATLHPWVSFVVMPCFALANAGVVVAAPGTGGGGSDALLGVFVGLLVGKPVGVVLACYVTARLGLAAFPRGIGWRHVLVLGMAAGIGFTMSIFIATLAFASPALLASAKLGVLIASGAAALLALGLGAVLLPSKRDTAAAASADEAEASNEL